MKNYGNGITEDQIKAAKTIDKYIQTAVNSWTRYNNTRGNYKDMSGAWYGKAEKIAKAEAEKMGASVKFDYPGLYPTFEVTINGKTYSEYNTGSFFRRINGFWAF